MNSIVRYKASETMRKVKTKNAALVYCELKMYAEEEFKSRVESWRKVREYIIKCY
jgi:hypothetical protein